MVISFDYLTWFEMIWIKINLIVHVFGFFSFPSAEVCDGNINPQDTVESLFAEPILAVKVRIVPLEWNDFIALRFELLGCK